MIVTQTNLLKMKACFTFEKWKKIRGIFNIKKEWKTFYVFQKILNIISIIHTLIEKMNMGLQQKLVN